MIGFGEEPFGESPFGVADWSTEVLYNELPEDKREKDVSSGGWYDLFAQSIRPAFDELLDCIERAPNRVLDARTARADLLRLLAGNFGIVPDLDEPLAFQRMKIDMVGQWRMIKGRGISFDVLAKIHGFLADIDELWWNGVKYSTDGPHVTGEVIGYAP